MVGEILRVELEAKMVSDTACIIDSNFGLVHN